MKKTIVISLRKVVKKIILFTLIAVCFTWLFSLKIPHMICQSLANGILSKQNSGFTVQFSKIFSLTSGNTVYAAMPIKEQPTTPIDSATPKKTTELSFPTPTQTPPVQTNLLKDYTPEKILLKNHTQKTFNISELLQIPLSYQADEEGYKVLIVHTHTTECYFPNDRSENEQENMIQVGKEMKAVLEENGISTLHIETVHDVPYATSYKKSLESVTKALAEHPSIEVVIDVHRDAIYGENGEKVRPITTVNQMDTAQVMLVCGTDEGGLPHPDWKENLSFALKIQNEMQQTYENLARPLDLRKERFNTHTTKKSVIFEIGSHGNTLEEALRGARLAAQSVATVLNNAG